MKKEKAQMWIAMLARHGIIGSNAHNLLKDIERMNNRKDKKTSIKDIVVQENLTCINCGSIEFKETSTGLRCANC